ncbi:hypothetical protein BH23ACT9_BH23ACT9_16020 [soil metagenome]
MLRRFLLSLAILSLLSTALPVAAADGTAATFQGLGCYRGSGQTVGDPRAQLVEVCVNYDSRSDLMSVVAETAAPNQPLTDSAWTNDQTMLLVAFSIDGDDTVDRVLRLTREDGGGGPALVAAVTRSSGATVACDAQGQELSGRLVVRMQRACLDEAPAIRLAATMTYQPEAGGSVAMDTTEIDGGLTAPLPDTTASPVCANAGLDRQGDLDIVRLACGGVFTVTEPVIQGVATSQYLFDDPNTPAIDPYRASWVVLARDDDFADALAGSTLSFGQGPLLFTHSPVSAPPGRDPNVLAEETRQELLRSLPRGKTVYLLGGINALSDGLDRELADLGYVVTRFAGPSREGTARLISAEVDRIVADFARDTGFVDTNMVLIANRANWPDAVLAGSVGAFWGMPILLVEAQLPVHPETLAALDDLRPDYIHNIGGSGVISSDVAIAIREHANFRGYALGRPGEDITTPGSPWVNFCAAGDEPRYVCRWGGDNRLGTSVATTQLNRDMVARFRDEAFIPPNPQEYAVAVFLGTTCAEPQPEGVVCPRDAPEAPNFSYVLSAATVSGRFGGAVFIPTEDQTLSAPVRNGLCNTPGSERFIESVEQIVVVGGPDRLSDGYLEQMRDLVQTGC